MIRAHEICGMSPPQVEQECIYNDTLKLLTEREFDYHQMPSKPRVVLSLGDKAISTAGNITNVQGPPKAGKSSVISAILGSFLGPNVCQTLGFSSANPDGKAVIHIDSEQSRYDHDALIRLSLRRAALAEGPPVWLHSYCLTDLKVAQREKAFFHAVEALAGKHGGIHAIIIDGVADLCCDPNDSAESFALIDRLQSTAIKHDCVVITVLHENPGSEHGKTRGHLGSQLERKAETCLRVAKDSAGLSTIWCDRGRHGDIPKAQGTCFQWSADAGMHIHIGTSGTLKAQNRSSELNAEVHKAFKCDRSLTYSALVGRIREAVNLRERAAKNRVTKYQSAGLIETLSSGDYTLLAPSGA